MNHIFILQVKRIKVHGREERGNSSECPCTCHCHLHHPHLPGTATMLPTVQSLQAAIQRIVRMSLFLEAIQLLKYYNIRKLMEYASQVLHTVVMAPAREFLLALLCSMKAAWPPLSATKNTFPSSEFHGQN